MWWSLPHHKNLFYLIFFCWNVGVFFYFKSFHHLWKKKKKISPHHIISTTFFYLAKKKSPPSPSDFPTKYSLKIWLHIPLTLSLVVSNACWFGVGDHFMLNLYNKVVPPTQFWECPRGVMVKVMDFFLFNKKKSPPSPSDFPTKYSLKIWLHIPLTLSLVVSNACWFGVGDHFMLNLYNKVVPPTQFWESPHGVMVKVMDCGIVVREFVLQSRDYVPFRANTIEKGMNPLILSAMG